MGQFQLKLIESLTNEDMSWTELMDEVENTISPTEQNSAQDEPNQMKITTVEISEPKTELTDLDEITYDIRNNDHLTQNLEPCQSQITKHKSTEAGGLESSDDTRIQRTKSTSRLNKILEKILNQNQNLSPAPPQEDTSKHEETPRSLVLDTNFDKC